MNISQSGLDLIKKFEGLSLKAYKCPAGIWTIGYGSTRGVLPGMKITQSGAESRLLADLVDAHFAIEDFVKVSLNQNEYDALCSFIYNIGSTRFASSTLLKYLNNGDRGAAAEQFLRWNKAGGKVLKGLTRRRQAEKELFSMGDVERG